VAKRKLGPNKSLREKSVPTISIVEAVCVALVTVIADVATDPRQLKPGELCKILNSTPLGPVLTDPLLRSHRERAGLRIGDNRTIDLLKYTAWLFTNRTSAAAVSPEKPTAPADAYEAKKERERERNAAASRSGRDIGELPPVADPERRRQCEADPVLFYRTYFPKRFPLEFSDDHIAEIQTIERIMVSGGVQAFAGPRGFGKTSLCEVACIRAACKGYRKFLALIGASKEASDESMDSIKSEFETNDILAADYPEICYPIQMLEGINNRCKGQTYLGQRTRMQWSGAALVLPTIPGSVASGIRIQARGITGRLRGMKFKRPDGSTARPDLAIVDDPQTDASARSPAAVEKRMKLLCGTILGLAGPGEKIAVFVPCTIIQKGDLADQILDRDQHPEFHGVKTKMLYSEPSNTKLWEEYAELRRASLRNDGEGEEATAFYAKNRKAMDEGAKVAWPDRFEEGQLSGIEYAMCIKIDRPYAFAAEYQNDPLADATTELGPIDAKIVLRKVNGLARGIVPLAAQHLVCFIDVQLNVLYFVVVAWSKDYTGAIIDYGTWPDQRRSYFTYREVSQTIRKRFPKASPEGGIRQALESLVDELANREWQQEGGSHMRIERIGVDSGNWTQAIYQFCRESEHSTILRATKGISIERKKAPITQWKKKPGAIIGNHWMLASVENHRAVRLLSFDTDVYKSRTRDLLHATHGDSGSLSLFGKKGHDHQMLSDHLASENPKSEDGGKEYWKDKPGKPDNHLLDTTVGAVMLASTLGCALDPSLRKNKSKSKSKPFPGKTPEKVSSTVERVQYL